MTKNDFIFYIQSFKKGPGDFTDDEIYDIGKKHKTLPKNERNWSKLAEVLGYPSGESLRSYVNRRMKSCGELIPAALSSSKFLNDVKENVSDKINQRLETLYKEQTKTRDAYNAYRRTLRDEARLDAFIEEIKNVASNMPKLPNIKLKSGNKQGKIEAVLLLSDWHIGQLTKNFYNGYDLDIARKRVEEIVNKTINYCLSNNVTKLNILNLGDLIEGIIHINARIEQQMDVTSQVIAAAELLAEALNLLQSAAPIITYRSCSDNHSRITPDKNQNIAKENLNRIIDWYIEERLKNSSIQFIHDNLDIGLGRFELLNGMKLMFFHGHEDAKSQTLQNMVGATQEWVDVVCCGHWHNPAEHTFQNMKLFVNNSLCGTSNYALSKRLFTKPGQKLLLFKGKDIINIDLNLE